MIGKTGRVLVEGGDADVEVMLSAMMARAGTSAKMSRTLCMEDLSLGLRLHGTLFHSGRASMVCWRVAIAAKMTDSRVFSKMPRGGFSRWASGPRSSNSRSRPRLWCNQAESLVMTRY